MRRSIARGSHGELPTMDFHLPRSRGLPLVCMPLEASGSAAVAEADSASHWAVSRRAAPSAQSLLYQPQEARVESCGELWRCEDGASQRAEAGPRFCGSGGSGTPGSSRSSSACSRSKREKRKRTA